MDGPVVSLDDNTYRSCAAKVTLSSVSTPVLSTPHEIYDGGYAYASERGVLVRIANGTAGQVGLLRAWADSFIQHMVDKGEAPFQVRVSFSTILISTLILSLALSYRLRGTWEIAQRRLLYWSPARWIWP